MLTKHEQRALGPLDPLMDLESEVYDLDRDARIADRLTLEAQNSKFEDVELCEEAAHAVYRLKQAVTDFKALFFRLYEDCQVAAREAEVAS